MAPPNLQGLNIVHPAESNSFDSQDLLSGSAFPDLAAQLDLWTHLPFESEDGAGQAPLEDFHHKKSLKEKEEEESDRTNDSHSNSVPGTPHFDINAFLSGFNLDPSLTIPHAQQPSLAQLLALAQNPSVGYPSLPLAPGQAPSAFARPTPHTLNTQQGPRDESAPPPAKRARSRKASVSTAAATSPTAESPEDSNSLNPAEDKRRRNTAASARFRLKKKEREVALESKAKELEARVNELERECEGLRRENGWLKGLVVGVTGAAQGNVVPPTSQTQGVKRGRDEA